MKEPESVELSDLPNDVRFVDLYIPIARWSGSNIWTAFALCTDFEEARRALLQSTGYEDHKILVHHEPIRKTESIFP